MAFSFNFTSDDIEYDAEEESVSTDLEHLTIDDGYDDASQLFQARNLSIDEMQPSFDSGKNEHDNHEATTIPRREIFDVRTQLMAEVDLSSSENQEDENESLITGLEKGDLKPRIYEGGFKTWECALDLAKLLARDEADRIYASPDGTTIIELLTSIDEQLGTGTGIPSLVLLQYLLTQPRPAESKTPPIHFVFADYNAAVLKLVTLPNILLTWAHCHYRESQSPETTKETETETDFGTAEEDDAVPKRGHVKDEDLELDITPELLSSFREDLAMRGIQVSFISGAWSPEFVSLALPVPEDVQAEGDKHRLLILASETIYSPASLRPFSETLASFLKRRAGNSTALVAAKKVYFGIGGGVDEFLSVLRDIQWKEGQNFDINDKLEVEDVGVGRLVLEIKSLD
ncbi:hypothetical protein KEM54_003552 [Ascosphaera aggregata]|nr:hypothetical protein KEM54_003552 [Ascosphaera aggregata]